MQFHSRSSFVALLALSLLAGCGPDRPATAPLTGQVTLDGRPLAGAALIFSPVAGGRPAQAVTDADGRYQAWTFEPGDGALLGEHRVAVSLVKTTGAQATADGLEGATSGPIRTESLIPAQYSRVETSGLTAQVAAGEKNAADFALSSR